MAGSVREVRVRIPCGSRWEAHREARKTSRTPLFFMRRHIGPIGQRFAVERKSVYTPLTLHGTPLEPRPTASSVSSSRRPGDVPRISVPYLPATCRPCAIPAQVRRPCDVSPQGHRLGASLPAKPRDPGVSEAASACPGRLRDARGPPSPAAPARTLTVPGRKGPSPSRPRRPGGKRLSRRRRRCRGRCCRPARERGRRWRRDRGSPGGDPGRGAPRRCASR
jgi:hypothetical protein